MTDHNDPDLGSPSGSGAPAVPTNATGAGQWREQAEAARRQIREWSQIARDRAELTARVAQQIDSLVLEGHSPRGDVRVEMDGHGLLRKVEFAESAPQSSPLALSRALMSAHDTALRELEQRTQSIADEELADEPELAESLRSSYADGMPDRLHDDPEMP